MDHTVQKDPSLQKSGYAMKRFQNILFDQNGQEVFEKILAIWPPILRKIKRERILVQLALLMTARAVRRANQSLVIEATRMVVPKSYDPLFHMLEDMEKFKKTMLDTFVDMKAYNKIPIRVRRWTPARKKRPPAAGSRSIVAFCASPRTRGNTDLLIEEALKGARDAGAATEKIMLSAISMDYCIGCRKCKEPGYDKICILKDDMSNIYQKIIEAGAIIIGFPIYTGRECAQLSTFLDRWDGYERYMLKSCLQPGRLAMVIGTWGYPHLDTYDHVVENIISILNLHKVETVEALSACGFEGMLHGLDEKRTGVIARYPQQLHKAYAAGRSLARLLPR